jgi:hypothetical protein
MNRLLFLFAAIASLLATSPAQTYYGSREVQVHDLPLVIPQSKNPSAVLAASVETVLHLKEVCCNRDSALEDDIQASDPRSFADVAKRLNGRHLLPDGRPFIVSAQYSPTETTNIGHLITEIALQHAPLMIWNSHLYVVYGIVYVETLDQASGATSDSLKTLLLIDVRFHDARRNLEFDRARDDINQVQGFLFLTSTM